MTVHRFTFQGKTYLIRYGENGAVIDSERTRDGITFVQRLQRTGATYIRVLTAFEGRGVSYRRAKEMANVPIHSIGGSTGRRRVAVQLLTDQGGQH